MPKWKPARGVKKTKPSRVRQIGCIVWLAMAMAFVMWLFWAVVKPG